MFKPDEIHVVVVGGETNGYWRIMGCNYQRRSRSMSGDNGPEKIIVQDVQTVQIDQAPSFILPRVAGEERGGGLNGA